LVEFVHRHFPPEATGPTVTLDRRARPLPCEWSAASRPASLLFGKAGGQGLAGGPAVVGDGEVGGVGVLAGHELVAAGGGDGRVLVEQRLLLFQGHERAERHRQAVPGGEAGRLG
jgi:hypothetical protein